MDDIAPDQQIIDGVLTSTISNSIPKSRGFKMASLNITSLPAQDQNLDLLAINETRLGSTNQTSLMSLKGYELIRCDRNCSGGGVSLYLRSSINYKERTDLINNEIEALCIEIIKPNSKPFPVLACYKPPDCDADTFFNTFEIILTKLDDERKEVLCVWRSKYL